MHGADVCTLLRGDLVKIGDLVGRIEETKDPGERLRLLGALQNEVQIHSRLEEEVLFPAIERVCDQRTHASVLRRARREHQRTLRSVRKMAQTDPDTHQFEASLQILKERIRDHVVTEDQGVFAKVREGMGTEEMQKVGERLNRRRLEVEHLYRGRAKVAREASET